MKVRMRGTMAGPHGIFYDGDKPDLPEDLAKYLIASRQASPVDPEDAPEEGAAETTEAAKDGEKASQKSRGKRG